MESGVRTVSHFDTNEHEKDPEKVRRIQFKENDNLDNFFFAPCRCWTPSEEIVRTIQNKPPVKIASDICLSPFKVEIFHDIYSPEVVIQRVLIVGKEWRRLCWRREVWGEWINIDDSIDFLQNAGEDIQKNASETWNRYMIVDENDISNKSWVINTTTIDKIIEEIQTGTAKAYRNKVSKFGRLRDL